ncbi:MAG: prepilin-type N-terminal cleavage/methylation domain-containing protein [Myxococcota bacterium]|nr:prepilin-type N-terminal cleavage/methylation domain-containing protein [Myxococcota bacterium]
MQPDKARLHAGFTLIELMAVIVVIGLALGLVLPNLAASRGAQLEESGKQIASRLQLARERAIVTGAAHRVFLDLEMDSVAIEWHVNEDRAYAHLSESDVFLTGQGADNPGAEFSENRSISLSPPAREERDYFPIPNRFGNDEWLPEDIFIEGVNSPDGWIDDGTVQIVFQVDGSTDYAEISLVDSWGNRAILEIQPMLEIVRVYLEEES